MVGIVQNSREMGNNKGPRRGGLPGSEGNYLGRNYGKIKNISEREILLRKLYKIQTEDGANEQHRFRYRKSNYGEKMDLKSLSCLKNRPLYVPLF